MFSKPLTEDLRRLDRQNDEKTLQGLIRQNSGGNAVLSQTYDEINVLRSVGEKFKSCLPCESSGEDVKGATRSKATSLRGLKQGNKQHVTDVTAIFSRMYSLHCRYRNS